MNDLGRPIVAAGVALVAFGAVAQPANLDLDGAWQAYSKTAMSITGDVTVTDRAVEFTDGVTLPWVFVGTDTGDWDLTRQSLEGAIYKLTPPSDPTLRNGNTLCGSAVSFIVLANDKPDTLVMAVFTSISAPKPTSDDLCATYYFTR